MAHSLDMEEGMKIHTTDNDLKQCIIPYLKQHKLPTQKFISFGIEINDLINFDHQYFKALCSDMHLNSLESIRFAKLIEQLNQKINEFDHDGIRNNKHQLIQEIKLHSQNTEKIIDASFDELIEILNQRRKQLKQRLNHATQQNIYYVNNNKMSKKISSKSQHIEFIASNFSSVKNTLSSIGYINDLTDIKQPSFSLTVPDDNVCSIYVEITDKHEQDKENPHYNYQVQYKKLKDEVKDNTNVNWKITNSLIISNDDIQPLTTYLIRVRSKLYSEWSEWSETQSIQTKFDCIWNSKRAQRRKNVKVIDKHELFVDGNCSDSSLLCSSFICKYILRGDMLKSIRYQLILEEFCQPSMFGFVQHPIKVNMKHYWNSNVPLIENKHCFLVTVTDGSNYIHRYRNGKDTESGILSVFKNGIALKNVIKKGDHFIFDINFDSHCCNLYINDENHKVCGKHRETWSNIPNKIIPVYAHYCDSKLVKRNSRVKLKLIHYELR